MNTSLIKANYFVKNMEYNFRELKESLPFLLSTVLIQYSDQLCLYTSINADDQQLFVYVYYSNP